MIPTSIVRSISARWIKGAVPVMTWKTMRGCRRVSRLITASTGPEAIASGHPIRNSPAVGSARNSTSFTPWRSSSKTATPRRMMASPYCVGATPQALRSSRRTLSVCSRSAIERETAGCEVPSRCAALAMLPASTTDMSTRTSCSFRRRSMRSIGPMALPYISLDIA